MVDVVVSGPSKPATAWSIETNPKYTRAWIDSLAPLDNLDSVRELFLGLQALNRADLDLSQRFELMQLYGRPVREACSAFQGAFARVVFPMPVGLRRLAASLCQLHVEMARGYRLCLQDLSKIWLMPWRRRQLLVVAGERALNHLTEVLLQSYQLYLPYPAGVWRDAHTLFRLIELHGKQDELIEAQEGNGSVSISVSQRYRRLLMLGAANPYQMPYGECAITYRFLARWIDQVNLAAPMQRTESSGRFLVDAGVDAPPMPLGPAVPNPTGTVSRVLDASELVRTLHVFLRRLEKGEPAAELQMGVECLDSACQDMLQRLHRVYAQTATRRHSRIKRHETVMICAGISALHFFASGQKAFPRVEPALVSEPAALSSLASKPGASNEDYIALDEALREPVAITPENFRIDRWHVRDVSPQGVLITQDEESSVRFRVGDVFGIQRTSTPGHWSIGLVRWFRAQGEKGIEVGVEMIAPDAAATSIRSVVDGELPSPALMLPAVEAAHRPASVLVARGAVQIGKDYFLNGKDRAMRRVRILDAIEHTNAIEQVIVGNVIE